MQAPTLPRTDLLWTPAGQAPYLRRVHIRHAHGGGWFWFHLHCRYGEASIATWDEARERAVAHAADKPCRKPEKSFASHIEANPDTNPLRASWLCPFCKQYCPSHNPCDCCTDEPELEVPDD